MEKLKEIIELEKIYNIQLDIFDARQDDYLVNKNCWAEIDENGNVTKISIRKSKINEIKHLAIFEKLVEINLFENEIYKIEGLNNFKNLKYLNLSNNNLTKIEGLHQLENLETLYLGSNKIVKIENLDGLQNLKELNLSSNYITAVEGLDNLTKLISIDLRDNDIRNISLSKSSNLKTLNLAYNNVSDLTDLLKIESLTNVYLFGNSKIEIDYPKEVLSSGWKAVKEYSIKSRENIIFNNVKVLLLGNPNIGKSNLLEYLETKQKPIKANSTHGVQYKKLSLNNINFHVWDFGGQEYYHATHQLFFSENAINILLWGTDVPRKEIKESYFGLDYWVRIVQQLNSNTKEVVLLTENKIDLNNPKFSETHVFSNYEIAFPNLIFYDSHISLLELKNMTGFEEKLSNIANEVIKKFSYPEFYQVFWRRIEELNKDFATFDEINNRPNKDRVKIACEIFHNMGMLLYYPDIIPNKVFHKPQVLLNLLYDKILFSNKKYKLSKQEIEKLIENNTLELGSTEIINLLKKFNLVFEIKEELDIYFITQYLLEQSLSQKIYEKLGFTFCNIKIKADYYLISLAMLNIFSKYGEYVDKDKNEYLFWKNGIVINKNNENVLIKYNTENQIIELYTSINGDNKILQKEVIDFILDLPEDYSFPKRNFDNHSKKRWIDVMNEDDEDFAPHFSERIEQYPGYYEEFINRNYNVEYLWKSDYFTVFVSFDGIFFTGWNQINNSANLKEINFYNDKKESKNVNVKQYYFYINKNLEDVMEKEEKGSTTVNVHSGGIVGALNNSGSINIGQTQIEKPIDEKPIDNEIDEKIDKRIRIWKIWGIFLFLLYIIVYISAFVIQKIQIEILGFTNQDWLEFKKSTLFEILKYSIPLAGIYLFYKIFYDRLFDSSKEKAKRDLLRSKL